MNLNELLELNIATNSPLIEKVVAIEELSELTKEIAKDIRGITNYKNIAEEMADVEIMLEQMKIIYNNNDLVDRYKVEKLQRIKERLGV
jgi:NTP pyrophosphatase (non-canonical NTP hydrolase)